jgi:hypothetical protein
MLAVAGEMINRLNESAETAKYLDLMKNLMQFEVRRMDGSVSKTTFEVKALCMGRAASRDVKQLDKAFAERAREGYEVYNYHNVCKKSRYLLTNEDTIELQERRTFPEAEYVALISDGGIMITAGSDHNDATLLGMWSQALGKVFDPGKSKQTCPAVVAREAWPYEDVKGHWDSLRLRSWVTFEGRSIPFQDYPLADLLDLESYLKERPWLRKDGTALFSGSGDTLPSVPPKLYDFKSKDGVFPNDFRFEIADPVLDRKISHGYTIQVLEWPEELYRLH